MTSTVAMDSSLTSCDGGVPQLSLANLREKYADSDSRFVTVDGVDLHYKREGEGDVVLLLHASFVNLQAWDQAVDALKPHYCVIRLDFPSLGLSGSETKKPPEGRDTFDLMERYAEIVKLFCEKLKIDSFHLIGTSSGGAVAFRLAAMQPKCVRRLVLINSAGMPRTAATDPNRQRAETAAWKDWKVKPREFFVTATAPNFPSLDTAPNWFVDLFFDLARCSDRGTNVYSFETGDPKTILSHVKAPTLILWGMKNPTVMHLEADVIEHWMVSAPSVIKKYPDLGHYPYIEDSTLVMNDILRFLRGEMDQELLVTRRVLPDHELKW